MKRPNRTNYYPADLIAHLQKTKFDSQLGSNPIAYKCQKSNDIINMNKRQKGKESYKISNYCSGHTAI